MKTYSDAHVLEESPTVKERLVRESGERERRNGFTDRTNGSTHATPRGFLYTERKPSYVKRIIDILFGSLGFIGFLVLYPIIALGIKLSSRGGIIYRQERTGLNGYRFTCYKFRTMHDIELRRIDGKPVVTLEGDRRVFPFGRLLRRTNLDELPQIINVLKGEMSLVGPRPYPVRECSYWNNQFDNFYFRYSVKPGISGLAQINGYRGGTLDLDHMKQRLDYDLFYVRKNTPWFDLIIIFRTLLQMVHPNTNGH